MFHRILIWTIQNSTTTQIADIGDADIPCQWKIASLSSEEKTPCHGWLKRTICLPILLQPSRPVSLSKPTTMFATFLAKVTFDSGEKFRRVRRFHIVDQSEQTEQREKKKNERARLSFFREISFPFLLREKNKNVCLWVFFFFFLIDTIEWIRQWNKWLVEIS